MKKYPFILILILCVFTHSEAQINFGIRGGMGLNSIQNNTFLLQVSSEPLAIYPLSIAPDVGLFLNIPIANQLSIQPEIHYLHKGGKMSEEIYLAGNGNPNNRLILEAQYRVQYIEIPVVLKYQIQNEGVKPALMLGASYGRAISQHFSGETIYINGSNSHYAISGEGNTLDWDTDFGGNGAFNRNDVSAVIGASIEKMIGKRPIIFDVRYLHDMNDWRTEKLSNNTKAQVRNRNLLVTIGLAL